MRRNEPLDYEATYSSRLPVNNMDGNAFLRTFEFVSGMCQARTVRCEDAPDGGESAGGQAAEAAATTPKRQPVISGGAGLSFLFSGAAAAAAPVKPLPNPGHFDNFRIQNKLLFNFYDFFDGFQLISNKQLSPQFQVGHTWVVSLFIAPHVT